MVIQTAKQARVVGACLAEHITHKQAEAAFQAIAPILNDKNPFRHLDALARELAHCETAPLLLFLDGLAGTHA